MDTQWGTRLDHRADERFALCSTFKWILAAFVLARVDAQELSLDERLTFGASDLLDYAPVAREHVAEGSMSIEALARAIVVVSDNTAANLLLTKLGGPEALTAFARSHGDRTTRLDRNEPTLNLNVAGDPRDTSSPSATVGLMQQLLLGSGLSAGARARLVGWMRASETGTKRLRAGLPAEWNAGDKTGTGENGACNDVAVAFPPGRAPILVAAFLSESQASLDARQAALAEVASVVRRAFSERTLGHGE